MWLCTHQALCKQLAKELHSSETIVRSRLDALHEANPMMGLRGCRLGIVHPEISEMQVGVIFTLTLCDLGVACV